MKSLDQIEARTPISSVPITISTSGSYYLTKNLAVTSGNAISISASEVTLDLNGFTISSTAATTNATAILLTGGNTNITISNGHIKSNVTYGGTFTGTGFGYGIFYTGSVPMNVRVVNVSVSGVQIDGINLAIGFPTEIESCNVLTAGGTGITASRVVRCSAEITGLTAISATIATDCYGYTAGGSGYGVSAKIASNCYGQTDFGSGGGLNVTETAHNSHGVAGSGTAYGMIAKIAQNCSGISQGGYGLQATNAENCRGTTQTGTFGVTASSAALNCSGSSNSTGANTGAGVQAFVVENCHGIGNANYGITGTVIHASRGESSSGTGVQGFIGSSCRGTGAPGLDLDHNVDSF